METAQEDTVAGPSCPRHHSVEKEEHKNSTAKRRGPMDEMRQYRRVVVALFPQAAELLDDAAFKTGGGNNTSEATERGFFLRVFGRDDQPEWGLPKGWGEHLASVLKKLLDRPITKQEVLACITRPPGCKYQAVQTAIDNLGLHLKQWQLPLAKDQVQRVQLQAVQNEAGPLATPTSYTAGRGLPVETDDEAPPAPLAEQAKRKRGRPPKVRDEEVNKSRKTHKLQHAETPNFHSLPTSLDPPQRAKPTDLESLNDARLLVEKMKVAGAHPDVYHAAVELYKSLAELLARAQPLPHAEVPHPPLNQQNNDDGCGAQHAPPQPVEEEPDAEEEYDNNKVAMDDLQYNSPTPSVERPQSPSISDSQNTVDSFPNMELPGFALNAMPYSQSDSQDLVQLLQGTSYPGDDWQG